MPFDAQTQPLTDIEARVLATLMEKARTARDSYPLSRTGLLAARPRGTTREPATHLSAPAARAALADIVRQFITWDDIAPSVAMASHD